MQTSLNTAHTWFYESMSYKLDNKLSVCLAEGIKGSERQILEGGSFFPVTVQPKSRCVEVSFPGVLAFFTYDESFDTGDPQLEKDEGRFLWEVSASSFRQFSEKNTAITSVHQKPYVEYLLWCEDRVFQVLSTLPPIVTTLNKVADTALPRIQTFSN